MSIAGRRNFLLKVQKVTETYKEHKKGGVSTAYVYRTYIQPTFFIGEKTLYRYLTINYKRGLADLDKQGGVLAKVPPSVS